MMLRLLQVKQYVQLHDACSARAPATAVEGNLVGSFIQNEWVYV